MFFGWLGLASHMTGQFLLSRKKLVVGFIFMLLGAIWWCIRGIVTDSPDIWVTNAGFIAYDIYLVIYSIKHKGI
jgi:hypothetical protein